MSSLSPKDLYLVSVTSCPPAAAARGRQSVRRRADGAPGNRVPDRTSTSTREHCPIHRETPLTSPFPEPPRGPFGSGRLRSPPPPRRGQDRASRRAAAARPPTSLDGWPPRRAGLPPRV